jgi:hypothetical protein
MAFDYSDLTDDLLKESFATVGIVRGGRGSGHRMEEEGRLGICLQIVVK